MGADEGQPLLGEDAEKVQTEDLGAEGSGLEKRVPEGLFNPGSMLFRGIILLGCCFLTFGSYYCYDLPGALQKQLESFYNITSFEYEILYTIYSVPNMVLPFFGGMLVDRIFGVRLGGILFCGIITTGQAIWAAGSLLPSHWDYYVAVAGRFVFGLGGESLSVVQSTYCAKWFAGKELSLAFGITLSFSRIGSAFNLIVSPAIYKLTDLPITLFWGLALCCVSTFFACLLGFMDLKGSNYGGGREVKNDEKIQLKDVFSFPITIWFVYLICVSFYISIFVFITLASSYFQTKWNFSSVIAGIIAAIPYTCAAFMSPLFGLLVDRFGRTLSWVTTASVLCVIAFAIMQAAPGSNDFKFAPWVGMFILGTGYSLCAASLWPMVPMILKSHELGTGYGLMTALQNCGLAIFPLVAGRITSTNHYTGVIYMFMGCSFVATWTSLGLLCIDHVRGGQLNASAALVKQRLKQVEEDAMEAVDDDSDKEIKDVFGGDEDETPGERIDKRERSIEDEDIDVESPDPAVLMRPRHHRVVRNAYLLRIGITPMRL